MIEMFLRVYQYFINTYSLTFSLFMELLNTKLICYHKLIGG